MSTQSSFPRASMNDLFSSILKSDTPSSSSKMNLSPDMAIYSGDNKSTLAGFPSNAHRHQQRPVSEILKPTENFASPETQALDKWFEDLQQYESSLESMATASLDPKYKEEVQHVDQWFRYLNEAERTATIYTLLQHSTQVQIRFFTAVLQQMSKTDPLGALLSPHPEKADMQAQMASAMVKAELEASQKLLSVLPYQTGQVISRPNAHMIGRRNHIDRHSFALGDTEEYDRLFSSNSRNDFLSPSLNSNGSSGLLQPQQPQRRMQRNVFERPNSVIEGDLSSIFNNDWSYGVGGGGLVNGSHHQQPQQPQQRPIATGRPKSADISNWSFGASVSSKSVRDNKDSLASPWSGLSPTVATFAERQQQQNEDDVDGLAMMANKWHLTGNGGGSNRSSVVILNDDTKGFRRSRGPNNRASIPGTVPESDERIIKNSMQSPPPPAPANLSNPANIVLSMYDENNNAKSLFGDQYGYLRPTSPVPTQTKFNATTIAQQQQQQQQQQQYGQFLNPNTENGYYSDHSESSNRSGASNTKGLRKKFTAANALFSNNNNNNRSSPTKEKKNLDVVDMQLLEDVPAWLRSLRLHKYNPIFETMKWQDMLKMDDEALLGKGVAALGARRKLLKVFDQVKAHCQANNIIY